MNDLGNKAAGSIGAVGNDASSSTDACAAWAGLPFAYGNYARKSAYGDAAGSNDETEKGMTVSTAVGLLLLLQLIMQMLMEMTLGIELLLLVLMGMLEMALGT